MNTRTLEATAVHTVTRAASQPAEGSTVVQDVRDLFDAPTRAVDVGRRDAAGLPTRDHPVETATAERTTFWRRPATHDASTAAFAATEVLAVVPQTPTKRPTATANRGIRLGAIVLASALALGFALATWNDDRRSFVGTSPEVNTSARMESPTEVDHTPPSESKALLRRSAEQRVALEASAADALLAGKPKAALTLYRDLAEDDSPTFVRVVKILEGAP